MSDLSLPTTKALVAKSNVAGLVGSGKLTKVHEGRAPKDAVFPYGVIQRIPGAVGYVFGPGISKEDDLYLCKVVTERSPAANKSPQLFAEEMANIWAGLVRGDLVLTGGGQCTWNEKFSDFSQDEPDKDSWIFHRGFMQRVVTEP